MSDLQFAGVLSVLSILTIGVVTVSLIAVGWLPGLRGRRVLVIAGLFIAAGIGVAAWWRRKGDSDKEAADSGDKDLSIGWRLLYSSPAYLVLLGIFPAVYVGYIGTELVAPLGLAAFGYLYVVDRVVRSRTGRE